MQRKLRSAEKRVLRLVFSETVPVDQIWITDQLGLNDAPYTIPNPNPIQGGYLMNVGPGTNRLPGYRNNLAENDYGSRLLVHEAAHVWQGVHGGFAWGYVLNSALCQSIAQITSGSRTGIYGYTPGQPWSQYNAEQQASIVDDWFDNGMETSDERWPYIRDHIRKPGFGGRAYFFGGDSYLRWDVGSGARNGYPRSIAGRWPSFMDNGIDAALNRDNRNIYFFQGDQYIRWTIGSGLNASDPKRIGDYWNRFMASGIDAAINWGNGKVFVFKDSQYIRLSISTSNNRLMLDAGFPKAISDDWPPFMAAGIDAAVNWGNGKAFFFKGSEFMRWTIGEDQPDSGYPRSIERSNWHSFMNNLSAAVLFQPKLF